MKVKNRVLVLSVADRRHMTMVSPYIRYLEEKTIPYDFVCTNRYEKRDEDYCIHKNHGLEIEYNMVFPPEMKKMKKIGYFLSFRKKVKKLIKTRKYSYIIIWNENTAVIFADVLCFKYKHKYCVNIRDVTTHQRIINKVVNKVLKKSHFITSPSPELVTPCMEKTLCVYNKDYNLIESFSPRKELRQDGRPIRITHLGFYSKVVRGANEIVDLLGNDSRFDLRFFGQGFDTTFKDIIEKKGITNVTVGGTFPYSKTAEYLSETDIINSYYNRFEHPSLKISFGVKHSYTPLLCIPGLADENTCWGRLGRSYGIVYLVNEQNKKSLADDLYNWYMSLDYDTFSLKCREFNLMIDDSIRKLYSTLDDALDMRDEK